MKEYTLFTHFLTTLVQCLENETNCSVTNTPLQNCVGDMGTLHVFERNCTDFKCHARLVYDFNPTGIVLTLYPDASIDPLGKWKLNADEVSKAGECIRQLIDHLNTE